MEWFIALFIYVAPIRYADGMTKSGKHKKSRFYKAEYKAKFGVK